jgi:hypothetical protein
MLLTFPVPLARLAARLCPVLFVLPAIAASVVAQSTRPTPDLVTPRTAERTGFQESQPYESRADLRTDFVMAYGVDESLPDRLARWREAGYRLHVMTGVAWGNYQDYLEGKFDGAEHWDEGQVEADGSPINHGATVPYMSPTVSFAGYLEEGIKRAIDGGAEAIHLEEPEFWARAGFGESFQREWQIYYREPWQAPNSSVDAQFRASRLKYYLYQRTLDRLCSSMKEYALRKHQRLVRFYVPTHSLLNYAQWRIVSPESSLLDLPGVDGYVAQVWTGTARTPYAYAGRMKERTFETAYLEYGVMQELVRGTNRQMWFLHDPIEDNPHHDWNDYRDNYVRTLVASLLHPDVWRYEVAPWPSRIVSGRFPRDGRDARGIPDDYATTLAVVFNQLRDMKQSDVDAGDAATGVGVFLSDSAMFQRAEPAFSEGVAQEPDDPRRPTSEEVQHLSGFHGLTAPLVKHGVPVRPVQLDNLARTPGYLDDFRVLILSYEFMKPTSPGLHLALAQWVRDGGSLIYVGADADPFHRARAWWNEGLVRYDSPAEHLFETLGLDRKLAEGSYDCGQGRVYVSRRHPAYYSRSPAAADALRELAKTAYEAAGGTWVESNCLQVRRGPYFIASVMDESFSDRPLKIRGEFVDLLDPRLAVVRDPEVAPNRQAWLLDLSRVSGPKPLLLAAAGRVENWEATADRLRYEITSPEGVPVVARLLLDGPPKEVLVEGRATDAYEWDDASRTLLIRHPGRPQPVVVEIRVR